MPAGRPKGYPKSGGMKKGYKAPQTLDKMQAREYTRQRIIAALEPLLAAQIANAQGVKYLVTREKKTGKFTRVGEAMARETDLETIEVWEKDPSVQAFSDLLNRALDKPSEHVEVTGANAGPLVVKWED